MWSHAATTVVKRWSSPNAKFIFITFENCDKTCSKIEKTWFLLGWWQKSIEWLKWMKNAAVIMLPQWCNLTPDPRFWADKLCLQAKLLNNTSNRLKGCNLIKKRPWQRCFPVNFVQFQGTTFYIELFIWATAFGLGFFNPRKKSMKELVY